jgi:hypothetical protein
VQQDQDGGDDDGKNDVGAARNLGWNRAHTLSRSKVMADARYPVTPLAGSRRQGQGGALKRVLRRGPVRSASTIGISATHGKSDRRRKWLTRAWVVDPTVVRKTPTA